MYSCLENLNTNQCLNDKEERVTHIATAATAEEVVCEANAMIQVSRRIMYTKFGNENDKQAVYLLYSLLHNLAGAEGLEPSARGFGDRCSTN